MSSRLNQHSPPEGIIHSQYAGNKPNSSLLDLESRVRFEHQRATLNSDVAAAKHRYLKKLGALERQLDQARAEKRDL